jgi:hypothetical protein
MGLYRLDIPDTHRAQACTGLCSPAAERTAGQAKREPETNERPTVQPLMHVEGYQRRSAPTHVTNVLDT